MGYDLELLGGMSDDPKPEFYDFAPKWEARIIRVLEPFLDGAEISEESRTADFEDGDFIGVGVRVGAEEIPRTGLFRCEVAVAYDYSAAPESSAEDVSRRWGRVLEGLGRGSKHGLGAFKDRLPEGDLVVPAGLDAVEYRGEIADDESAQVKMFRFDAVLGVKDLEA